ncbi:hypothetical protein VTO42DRAFT_5429 [Malbranchea cinnamomea]
MADSSPETTVVDANIDHTDSKSTSRSGLVSAAGEKGDRDLEKGLEASSHDQNVDTEQSADDPAANPSDRDPNIVDWDGPDDPMNPLNWSRKRKGTLVASISIITFLTPLGSSIFAPGVPEVMREFNSSNPELSSFVVSVYLLGFAFGPLILAPLSELYGRMYIYHVCNVLFVVFNVACAVANNLASLIIFRLLAGAAGSAPLTIGAGSMADIIRQERRGAAMAAWAMGPIFGPIVGPIAGGYLTERMGWRWCFWLLSILAGAVVLNTLIFMRESYHPIILQRKTNRLIKETGNTNLRSRLASDKTPRDLFAASIVRPCKMLLFSPIVLLMSVYTAIVYGYLYLLFTTISGVFMNQYGFSQGNVGLAFLGLGIGSIVGLSILGVASDRILQALAAKHGGEMKPEYRLPPLFVGSILLPVGLFWYGWSAKANVHWMMPIVGTVWVGAGMMCVMMGVSAYLVDAFTLHSASAMAANTVLRSIFGAVLPLAGVRMYDTLGLGWGNSLLAFIAIGLAPVPGLFFKYGERIRTSKRFTVTF